MRVTDEMIYAAWNALDVALAGRLDGTEYAYGDHTPMKHALEQVFALSHAAGQDGEQCRAASGDREAMATRLRELICEYWDLAYDEGVDKRNSDTPAGDANRVANEIETIIRALSRGVPEGMVLVPVEPTFEMRGACQQAFVRSKNDQVGDMWRAMVGAAIASQRKEGE